MRSFVLRKKVPPLSSPCYVVTVPLYELTLFFLIEYAAQKEEIANTIKANYEKVLNTERTLKTQVKMNLFSPDGEHWSCKWRKVADLLYLNLSGGEQAGGDHEPQGHEAGPEEEGQHCWPAEEGEGESQASAGAQPGEGEV